MIDKETLLEILRGNDTQTKATFDDLLKAAEAADYPLGVVLKGGECVFAYVDLGNPEREIVTLNPGNKRGLERTRIVPKDQIQGLEVLAF